MSDTAISCESCGNPRFRKLDYPDKSLLICLNCGHEQAWQPASSGSSVAAPRDERARDGETLSDEQITDIQRRVAAYLSVDRETILALCDALRSARAECARLTAEREEITQACNTGMRLRLPAEQIVARIRAARAAAPTPGETTDV